MVVAAGPWSWSVCRSLAHDVPVRGVRGWIIVTRPAPFRLRHVIEEEWTRTRAAGTDARASSPTAASRLPYVPCVLQQDSAGRVLVGASLHGAIGHGDESPETRRAIARRAVEVVPALAGLEIAESRSCQRPYSPDGLPLLGPYPGVGGLVLATGHGSLGVTQSLGSGEAVADGIASRRVGRRARARAAAGASPSAPGSGAGSRSSGCAASGTRPSRAASCGRPLLRRERLLRGLRLGAVARRTPRARCRRRSARAARTPSRSHSRGLMARAPRAGRRGAARSRPA